MSTKYDLKSFIIDSLPSSIPRTFILSYWNSILQKHNEHFHESNNIAQVVLNILLTSATRKFETNQVVKFSFLKNIT